MARIVKGKTEAEHQAEEQARKVSRELPSEAALPGTGLPEKEAAAVGEAIRELEERKGDFSKDR